MKIDILSLKPEELEREILAMGEKKFRASQIYDAVFNKGIQDINDITNISKSLRERLANDYKIDSLNNEKKLVSKIKK